MVSEFRRGGSEFEPSRNPSANGKSLHIISCQGGLKISMTGAFQKCKGWDGCP